MNETAFSGVVATHLRKTIYITLILGILISCKQKKEPKQTENKPTEIPVWKIDLDTILERNNPKSLDLTKHQLFIDTTRNSEFYEKLINWQPNRMDNDAISYYEKEIAKKHKQWKIPKGIYRLKTNRTNFNFALANIQSNKIQIWNAQKGKLIQELETENGFVQTLHYTENGKYLIIGTEECEVIIYDNIAKTIIQRYLLNDCEKAKGIVSISSDLKNNRILLGIRHSDTKLIDFNTGKLIKSFKSYGASSVNFNEVKSKFYEGTGIASINNLYITDIEMNISKKIKDDNSFMHYRDITIPKNKKYWLVAGNGIMFMDKENNELLLEIFFHRDKNKENKDLWWNAINFTNNKVGGSDTKYLLKNKNEISMKNEIFDEKLILNFIKKTTGNTVYN